MEVRLPDAWADDSLSGALDTAFHNQVATFSNLPHDFGRFVSIDGVFEMLLGALSNSDELPAVLVIRSHSAYRSAVQLVTAGQVPESYACARLALENALYAFYLFNNTTRQEKWLRRHDSDDALRVVKREFKIGAMFDELTSVHASEAATARELYDWLIDYGAHPNERGINQSLEIEHIDGRRKFKSPYFTGDTPAFRAGLKRVARTGISCLSILRLPYRERFKLLAIDDALHAARQL